MKTVDLSKFSNPDFDRGAGRGREALWLALRQLSHMLRNEPDEDAQLR